MGSKVLTFACVTCPDDPSTVCLPAIVIGTRSSLAWLPILNGAGLIYDFLDLISHCRIISEDSSSVASSSAGSGCCSSCGGVTSTAQGFFC
ncbi:hypothetical protein R1flu_005401 [Riccia fluitans]|uniref:Uncharacterized protein n=1 Tax=Riccia fluitans TaxID=41844 RepID=A0ABD1YX22_9MARC